MRRVLAVGALFAALLISTAPVASAGSGISRGDVKVVPASNHVTGHYAASCKAKGDLPDLTCTPGSASDAVTQNNLKSTICIVGYTKKVRPPSSETSRLKTTAMKAYGIPASARATTQLDHKIPLELGGSSDVTNLWPELGTKSFTRKDGVEARLRTAACSGKVTLKAAQNAIASDWTTALHKLGLS